MVGQTFVEIEELSTMSKLVEDLAQLILATDASFDVGLAPPFSM